MSAETTHLLPDPHRIRQRMPKRFSWIDQRALDRLQSATSPHAYGLYLALVLLGNRHGLSYYSDKSLSHRLRVNIQNLRDARSQLLGGGLIAYRFPFYQVLDLEPVNNPPPSPDPTLSSGQRPGSRSEHTIPEHQSTMPLDIEEARKQLRALQEQLRTGYPHP